MIDLTAVTRDSDKIQTIIKIDDLYYHNFMEIKCGRVDVKLPEGRFPYGSVCARADYGITDFEHDSAYIFKLPLVDVKLQFVLNGNIFINAILLGNNDFLDFNFADDYNPFNLKDSFMCAECTPQHLIVPEGYYCGPPTDLELYQKLIGKKVEIIIHTVEEKVL